MVPPRSTDTVVNVGFDEASFASDEDETLMPPPDPDVPTT